MRFLDWCQLHNENPFDPASKEAHARAQRLEHRAKPSPRDATFRYLRTLRKLDTAYWTARGRAEQARAFNAEMEAKAAGHRLDDGTLRAAEAVEAEAEAAYKAHAAERPELAAEYELRAQEADLVLQLARADATLARLPTVEPPDAGPSLRADALARAAEANAERLRALARNAERAALDADAEYQALDGDSEGWNWLQRAKLGEEGQRLGANYRKLDRRADAAETRASDLRRKADASAAKFQARLAEYNRQPAERSMQMHTIDALRRELADVRRRLPATVSAPWREPRKRKGRTHAREQSATYLDALNAARLVYRYDPATDTFTRHDSDKPMHLATATIGGVRLARADLIEALRPTATPSTPDANSLRPEDLV